MPATFTDRDALNLLRLLEQYARAFSPDLPQTLSALAEDLAVDGGVEADQLRASIQSTEGIS